MPLKTFSLNKALFSNLSRSIIFLTIVNIICTFILVPFSYVIAHVNRGDIDHSHSKYLVGEMMTSPLYFVGSMMYALLCAAFLTYFFKSQAASDFIHSLPIKRERILITSYAVFFTHLLVNLLINGVITWIVGIKYASIDIEKIIIWILVNLLIDYFVFTITMLFGLYINNMLNHIISSVILIFSPFILGTLIFTTHMFMFKGLQTYPDNIMKEFTVPVRFVEDLVKDNLDAKYLLIVFIVSLILFALLFVVYRRRKNERINEAYSTNYANFIVFVVSMLIATLLGGIIYNSIFLEHSYITIFIYFVSFTLVYIFLEMLSQKSARINLNRKLYAITLGIVAAALVGVYVMGQVRENYVPEQENIEAVNITLENGSSQFGDVSLLNSVDYDSPKVIRNVINIQKYLIQLDDEEKTYSNLTEITYKMKNGSKVKRSYTFDNKFIDKFNEILVKDIDKTEFIKSIPWDKLKHNDIELVAENNNTLSGNSQLNKKVFIENIPLINKTIEKNITNNELYINSYGGLLFMFNETADKESIKFPEENGYTIPISIYDKEMLDFLIKNNNLRKYSDALPSGKVYYLGNVSNFKKAQQGNIPVEEQPFAKKFDKNKFKKLVDAGKANVKGTELYYLTDFGTYVVLDK